LATLTCIYANWFVVKGIPLGVYLTFSHHLGLTGLWIGLSVALLFIAVVLWAVTLGLDWEDEVRQAKKRVGAGEPTHGEEADV
jgi:MATE family multidrug resistance protein